MLPTLPVDTCPDIRVRPGAGPDRTPTRPAHGSTPRQLPHESRQLIPAATGRDLSLLVEEATETLLPLAEKHGVTIETTGDIAPTSGSQALLLQLTTNLVHNAIVHNLPEKGTIRVHTGVRTKTVVLTVENTGEKLTPEVASTLTEPFQRGTERIHADHAGVGLGLAVVRTITHAHDGTLTLTARAVGGLRITVELPATATHADG